MKVALKKLFSNGLVRAVAVLLLLSPFFFLLFRITYQRFAMFGCFDECMNYLAGDFILQGKVLYGQYFFPHQMLMPYLSSLIQFLLHPQSIYYLVLYHRMFIFFFAILMDILIILRFRKVGLGFVLFFETTKFYFMGSLFLPESVVAYLLVYLFGLTWTRLTGKKLSSFDYILSGLFTWAAVFMREPYIPVAIIMYAIILWGGIKTKAKLLSLAIFSFLSFVTLVFTDLQNYFYQVWFVNFRHILGSSSGNKIGIAEMFKIFLYPVYIFMDGKWNFLRNILMGLSTIFLLSSGILITRFKKIKLVIVALLILGFSNSRFVAPGVVFYEAFHMLVWYGLFIMLTLLLIKELYVCKANRLISGFFVAVFSFLCILSVLPGSFFEENIHGNALYRDSEFRIEFDRFYVSGEAIRLISDKGDTLFVDLWNDLIYWQAKLNSSYKYTNYWGQEAVFPIFKNARLEMFHNNPPDFYYYACSDKQYASLLLPEFVANDYVQLYYINKPSCLYIKKTKYITIPAEKWDKIKVLRFYKPEIL